MVTNPCSHICPPSVTSLTCSFPQPLGFRLMFKTRHDLLPNFMSSSGQAIAFGHIGFFVLFIKEVYQEKHRNEICVLLKLVIKL